MPSLEELADLSVPEIMELQNRAQTPEELRAISEIGNVIAEKTAQGGRRAVSREHGQVRRP